MKKKFCISIFFTAFAFTTLFSQTTFQITVGGTSYEIAWSISQTFDKGFIVGGEMESSFGAGFTDGYLVKMDSVGTVLWKKSYGGTSVDYGHFVQQTADSGYIFVGGTKSFGVGYIDIYLLKLDASGNILWEKTYGGTLDENAYCVRQTSDGGYIIAGTTPSFGSGLNDVYLIKTDSVGNVVWTKTYGGADNDKGYSVSQTSDGGYIISGETYSFSSGGAGVDGDVYLIKTNALGDTLWTKSFGGALWDYSFSGDAVQQTSDGGYIIGGEISSFGAGDYDVYLVKLDSLGNIVWNKTFGSIGADYAHAVKQTSDGGYVIAGTTNDDIYLLKTDSIGNLLWSKAYGGAAMEEACSVCQIDDGRYVVAGHTYSFGVGGNDFYIIKTDTSGNSLCNGSNPATITTTPVVQIRSTPTLVSSGCITTTPVSTVGSGGIVMEPCHNIGIQEISDEHVVSIYPNPFSIETTLKINGNLKNGNLTIYNTLGEEIKVIKNISGKEIRLQRGSLKTGIYFISIMQDNNLIATDKLIIVD